MNWAKFRGLGTLTAAPYDIARAGLDLARWIENLSHTARRDRVEVAHARLKTRRATAG